MAEVTYQKELFLAIMPELPELFQQEYEEAVEDKERHKLNPAWKRYVELELAGVLHVLTARADARLVGYFINMLFPHLHFSDLLCASSDTFYILPEHRGHVGLKLFRENELMLKKLNVRKVIIIAEQPLEQIMKRLKYKASGGIFFKWL